MLLKAATIILKASENVNEQSFKTLEEMTSLASLCEMDFSS